MVNKKELKMQRIEPLWKPSGTHTQIFFLDLNVTVEVSNRLTLQISRFHWTDAGQNQLLNPTRAYAARGNEWDYKSSFTSRH